MKNGRRINSPVGGTKKRGWWGQKFILLGGGDGTWMWGKLGLVSIKFVKEMGKKHLTSHGKTKKGF